MILGDLEKFELNGCMDVEVEAVIKRRGGWMFELVKKRKKR
jgi:hypothetical protein